AVCFHGEHDGITLVLDGDLFDAFAEHLLGSGTVLDLVVEVADDVGPGEEICHEVEVVGLPRTQRQTVRADRVNGPEARQRSDPVANHGGERVRVEGGAPHQRPVDVTFRHHRLDVPGVDRAAVEDSHRL